MSHNLAGKTVLVTGGTGLIGGRVVEKLVQECKANVRVLLRNYGRALRIARYPIQMLHGDISQPADIARAAQGCEIIIHCAYGNSGDDESRRSVNVEGTRNVLEAGLRAGVKRLVHLSTIQVYGPLSDGDLDESKPRRYYGHTYSDSKLDAEEIVLEYFRAHGLPVVVLQPTVVYGPYSLIWTTGVLSSLRKERQILVDGGDGFCNAVFIDDVADAVILAAVRNEAVGETFLISAEEPVTWRDFYRSYERMLGISSTISMSAEEAESYDIKNRRSGPSLFKDGLSLLREDPALRQRILASREVDFFKRITKFFLPSDICRSIKHRLKAENGAGQTENGSVRERPVALLRFPLDVNYYRAKVTVRIDKAKRLLGYQPKFDLGKGMQCTEKWAKWANLLDA